MIEGMNRRIFLQAMGSSGVAGVSAALPTVSEATEPATQHPWEMARLLAYELSHVLAKDLGDARSPAGKWFAEIFPAGGRLGYEIQFSNIAARRLRHVSISFPFQQLVDRHKAARANFLDACEKTDRAVLGREPSKAAWRRLRRAEKAEIAALTAVCAFPPHGRADAIAKVRHLRKFVKGGDLTAKQVMAIANAAVPQ